MKNRIENEHDVTQLTDAYMDYYINHRPTKCVLINIADVTYMDYYINHRPQKILGGMPPRTYKQAQLSM